MRNNKYNASKKEVDGIKFDSKKEARRYLELVEELRKGEITNLTLQPQFLLVDKFTYKGRTIRSIKFIADFRYVRDDKVIVEDVKGRRTDVYNIKKKLFLKLCSDQFDEFLEV